MTTLQGVVDFVNYVLAFQSAWLQKCRDVE